MKNWVAIFLMLFLLFVILIEYVKMDPDMNYFDAPNPDHQLEPLDQDPTEKFADNSQLTTLTQNLIHGPSREKSFIGRPPSLYGPRVYRTLA